MLQKLPFLFVFLLNVSLCFSADQSVPEMIRELQQLEGSRPDSAFLLASERLETLAPELTGERASLLLFIGKLFYDRGAYDQAVRYFQQADELLREDGDKALQASVMFELARVFYYNNQIDRAFDYLGQARERFEKLGNKVKLAEVFGELGHLHEKSSEYDLALDNQKRALQFYKEAEDSKGLAMIYENIGSIYEDLEKMDSAFHYFRKSYALNGSIGNRVNQVSNLNNLGDTYRKRGIIDSSLVLTRQALRMARELDLKYQESSALRDLGKSFNEAGAYDSAYYYLSEARIVYEELYSNETNQQLVLVQSLFDLNDKNAQIQTLEQRHRLERLTIIALVCFAVLIAILGFVFIRGQRIQLRKNKQLIHQKEQLHQSELENVRLEEERLKAELRHKQLEEEYLNLELDAQQKALASRMLQLIEKNKLLEEVESGLKDASRKMPEEFHKPLKKISKRISSSFKHDDDWEDFRRSFEQIQPDFFPKLQKVNADLSANDLRICALMRINLSSEDIASVLGITIDSLRVSRYRLRKKLMLKKGQNLRGFLLSV